MIKAAPHTECVAPLSVKKIAAGTAEATFAAARLGAILCALNWRLARDELAHCVALVEPLGIYVPSALLILVLMAMFGRFAWWQMLLGAVLSAASNLLFAWLAGRQGVAGLIGHPRPQGRVSRYPR